jgi:hypothetical protein
MGVKGFPGGGVESWHSENALYLKVVQSVRKWSKGRAVGQPHQGRVLTQHVWRNWFWNTDDSQFEIYPWYGRCLLELYAKAIDEELGCREVWAPWVPRIWRKEMSFWNPQGLAMTGMHTAWHSIKQPAVRLCREPSNSKFVSLHCLYSGMQ